MTRWGLLAVLALCGTAQANGRPAATSTIHFQRTHEDHIIAGMTFGLIESTDGGATWEWLCEDAIGYGGMFDPVYAYTSSGAILATTIHGLRVDRTGCDFELQADTGNCTTAPDAGLARCTFITTVTQLPDGTLFYGASDPNDAQIYKSIDDGQSWTPLANPGELNDEWLSIVVAPSDNQVIYLADLRIHSATSRELPLFKSIDGGMTFKRTSLDPSTLTTSVRSSIEIVGIDKLDPNTFYIGINEEDGVDAYGIWKTTNGGDSFTNILTENDKIAFIVRANGDLVAGTTLFGTQVSHDKGAHWLPVPGAPHINCLSENSAGELWACTADKPSKAVPSDGAGIMTTVDLTSWTKVLTFEDTTIQPRMCAAGTIQQSVCDSPDVWCMVKTMVGLESDAIACPIAADDLPPPDGGTTPAPAKGCCDSGGTPVGLALVPAVAILLLRRRRRCSADSIVSRTTDNTCRF